MKKNFYLPLFFLATILSLNSTILSAQYGNEWIDYNKSYWKFSVGQEGIYRISKAALLSAGLPPTTNGSDYVLYRDGKEVTLYVTTNGVLGSSDYIEFYATANTGVLDKKLYLDTTKYANENISLFSDSSSYFLTVDNLKSHNRYTAATTPIPSTPPTALSYCWYINENNTKNLFCDGKTNAPPEPTSSAISKLYSSQFDRGEGYTINWFNSVSPADVTIPTPNLVTGTMNARLKTAVIAQARDSIHKLKVSFNSNIKADVVYDIFDTKHFDFSIPSNQLTSSNLLNFTHSGTGLSDNFGLTYWSIEYPRDWNVSGVNYFRFSIDGSPSAQYLEILNFNHSGIEPRLYDMTNNKWYKGDISVIGKTRFYIDPSVTKMSMVLYASSCPKIYNPIFNKQITFTNFSNPSNQGDYIIITHKNLTKITSGRNYIQDYKDYRSSALGGSHKVVVADIEELYDQFAFGTYTHPSSIKNLIDFALEQWITKPKNVFIIGKGITYEAYHAYAGPTIDARYVGLVPTFGTPGSDVAFVTDRATWKMKLNIGRLSAWSTTEVGNYLNKIKAYEAALLPASFPTPSTELWKKQVLHVAGGNDAANPYLQSGTLLPTLKRGEDIITSPKIGAIVTTKAKNTTGLPTTIDDKIIDSLISNGLSYITYYGHGSALSLDYNIKEPSEYTSLPRIPIFTAYGCDISRIYYIDSIKTVTERYVSAPVSGSVVSIASNNLGYTYVHSIYIPLIYQKISQDNYGQTIGDQFRAANDSFMTISPSPYQTSLNQTHMESLILQGDPATYSTFTSSKADYYVGSEGINTIPFTVSTALDSFQLNINTYNLGRAFDNDTVLVKVEHTNPLGKTVTVNTYPIVGLTNLNTTTLWIPIDKTKDVGINKFKITIDPESKYDEMSEANNSTSVDVFIVSDNIVPIYPYDFSIVYNSNLTLKASTLNPFKEERKYRLEIDTTELFNSSLKLQTSISSKGGIIKWKPSLVLQDSVVYYWRTAVDTLINGNYIWSKSSFVYLKNGSTGWNQSHYYQYKYNNLNKLTYDSTRKFKYIKTNFEIQVFNAIMELGFPYSYYFEADFNRVLLNGTDLQRYDCVYTGTLQIMVFDTTSGKAWGNPPMGKQGSNPGGCKIARNVNCFSFNLNTADSRNNARKFLDSIPNGNYVLVKNCINNILWGNYLVDTWKSDTAIYGSGKSLYHSMRNLGFNMIDSFNKTIAFSMICKKGYNDYPIQQNFGTKIDDTTLGIYTIPVTDISGKMNSITVGPSSNWKTLKWRTSALDTSGRTDSATVRIIGIDKFETESTLYEGPTRDTNLNFISANTYPKLKLQWFSFDSSYHTSPQLDYWRILYDPLPEAALNPSAYYAFTDSVSVGQTMNMETAIETLTELPMDSMLVRYKIIDGNGVSHNLADKKFRKLNGNDTLHASINFDPKSYPGNNFLLIEANPDNNQPEEYHPNNIGYLPFNIKTDKNNPVLDVTFDGTHILDRDIVSSKPFIKVLLRDENKFLALTDTSTIQLSIRYPSDPTTTRRKIAIDGNICKFSSSNMSAGKNEAYLEYIPTFTEDGIYQLFAKGNDISGNGAGAGNEYSISFEVINKSTISNLVNYPNPFSTSTAFVFTLTGWQIPSQFKIQILSVTGKVVREITKQELGNIHIGRNITEYKWDGKDQYGQVLGNGVYLYRVVTAIGGEDIEHRNSGVDKFYKNGYSKMYIMR